MSVLDLTSFTEIDPLNRLTCNPYMTKCDDMEEDDEAVRYKDYGANYFDALSLDFYMRVDSKAMYAGMAMGFSTALRTRPSSPFSPTDLTVTFIVPTMIFRGDGTESWAAWGGSNPPFEYGKNYYYTLKRDAGSDIVRLYCYLDSARTDLFRTLVVDGFGAVKWRYFYAMINASTGGLP